MLIYKDKKLIIPGQESAFCPGVNINIGLHSLRSGGATAAAYSNTANVVGRNTADGRPIHPTMVMWKTV